MITVTISRQWCKGCGVCVAFCPKHALKLDTDDKAIWLPELCSKCGLCERYCPDLAITVEGEKDKETAA